MMKRTIIVSAAFAATLATLAGCNPGGSYEQTETLPYKMTEVGPDGTYITEITYKPNTFETEKEVRTLNSMPFSEKTNFKSDGNVSSYLQTSHEGGVTTWRKIATTFGHYYYSRYYATKMESYLLTSESDTKGTLEENVETAYNENSPQVKEMLHKKNGAEILHDYDYDYTNFGGSSSGLTDHPYYTFKQSVDGGAPATMCFYVTRLNSDRTIYLEYEIYKDWVDTSNKGTLVESRSEYSVTGTTVSYTMKSINKDTGVMETTKTSVDHADVTVVNR